MAQTETRPGFRLPWGTERNETDSPADEAPASSPEAEAQTPVEELVTPDMIDMTTPAPAAAATRRPTKFMADLSRAMQAAAETSRDDTMARFAADATAAVEQIRNASTDEAAAIRRQRHACLPNGLTRVGSHDAKLDRRRAGSRRLNTSGLGAEGDRDGGDNETRAPHDQADLVSEQSCRG